MTQSSCASPILYMTYAPTMESVVETPTSDCEEEDSSQMNTIDPKDKAMEVALHRFADNYTLKNTFSVKLRHAERDNVSTLEAKAADVKVCMDQKHLKMNDSKTAFIMFTFRQMLQKCVTTNLNVNGSNIQCSDIIKYLGAWLDQHLELVHHITLKCRTVMLNFQRIKLIQPVLTINATHTLVRGLVTSHIDYCNVIFSGLPEYLLDLLQKVQNVAAKLVLGMKKHDSVTVALPSLHWLPIRARSAYKILTSVHKYLSGNAPDYLIDLLVPLRVNCDDLRSNNSVRHLLRPRTY